MNCHGCHGRSKSSCLTILLSWINSQNTSLIQLMLKKWHALCIVFVVRLNKWITFTNLCQKHMDLYFKILAFFFLFQSFYLSFREKQVMYIMDLFLSPNQQTSRIHINFDRLNNIPFFCYDTVNPFCFSLKGRDRGGKGFEWKTVSWVFRTTLLRLIKGFP